MPMCWQQFCKLLVMTGNLFDPQQLEKIHRLLVKRKETLAVAESVTSGLLQLALSQAECASEFYQGGITVYNLGQKYKHLQVEPIHAEMSNCVSEKVSAEMALHVCELFNSHWGIGITGYATPVPESGNKVFAFYAIAHRGRVIAKGRLQPAKEKPLSLQLKYVNSVMRTLAGKLR